MKFESSVQINQLELRIIFGKQLQKRMKQKKIWDNEHNKPDYEKLFVLIHPEKISEVDRKNKEPKYIHQQTRSVREWTNGQVIPEMKTLLQLSNILDCDINYFFTENAEMPNRDIALLCNTYNISRESSENLLAITKDKASVEMLNIILGNYTYLQRFLLHLYEIKNTQDEKERYSFNKLCDKKALALIPPNTEGQTDAILQEGFTISDAIKGNAINRINMIIDKWTARKDGDSI